MSVGLTDYDCARFSKEPHCCGVVIGHKPFHDLGTGTGWHALNVDNVFDRDRETVDGAPQLSCYALMV